MRKRYFRGSTFRYGQSFPLTAIASPNISGTHCGCVMPGPGYVSVPSVLKSLS
jgi:hypothetical protein